MQITLNGQSLQLPAETHTVAGLLAHLGYSDHFVAVAINHTCIARQHYTSQKICDRDDVEILAPMAGG